MKISQQKITWMSVSCIFAMLTGLPALADDTELLLANPSPSLRPKPNVMFILDTSGSMQTEEETTEPYDSGQSYAGNCAAASYYWAKTDTIPDCATTDQIFDDGAMVCDAATRLINGIGTYTDTMVQYRDGPTSGNGNGNGGPFRWQTIGAGHTAEFVECRNDSAVHGDGIDTTRLHADKGTDVVPFWTSNSNNELSWGSGKAKTQYTIFKGNYLNWKSQPNTVVWTRSRIMISVASTVLSSVSNMKVGLMRYNRLDGGPVVQDIVDIDVDANRQAILDAVAVLPASGFTPLSETLYESALFWRGMSAHYGENINEMPTDPAALSVLSPEVYEHPEWDVCAKNFNVLITDGEPFFDEDTPGLMGNLPGQGGACDGTGEGLCLDDIAEYLATVDVDPLTEDEEFVQTHTIGFTVDLPILQETADDSNALYFTATDVETLTRSLMQIIDSITKLSTSFAAPAVSVNSFNRTQNLNDLYITTFNAKGNIHWPGNVKKYRLTAGEVVDANGDPAVDPNTGFFVDTATSFWTTGGPDGREVELGGAMQQLPDALVRNLYTDINGNDLTAATNNISSSNAASFADADFGLTGAAGEPPIDELIRWARGEDTQDEDNNPATLLRKVMGDPLHAQPAAIVYGGTAAAPEIVVYSSTNDGYLHAIDGNTGVELWSYIPEETLLHLTDLYFDSQASFKHYGLDGSIVPIVKDVDNDGIVEAADGDFVQLIFGMRRGGNTTFALDVTDRNAPQLLWKVNQADFGESWSTPAVARVHVGSATQNADKAVVVIGGGYDVVHDTSSHPATADAVGASVHMFDLRTGVELWNASSAGPSDLTVATMTRAMPNQIRVVDMGGDGLADRMYASDMGGQLWRFDIFNGENPNKLVTGGVIARFGAETIPFPTDEETRRFYNAPDISLITDPHQQRRYVAVSIGSGYRAHPFDLASADRFFSFRDGDVFNQLTQAMYDNYPIATDADLVEVSGQTQTVVTANDRGWKFTLPDTQKILADSLTFNDEIFFVAFSPDTSSFTGCNAAIGTNFLYRMNAINGDPVVSNIEALNPLLSDSERVSLLDQGGIAPSPTILFPSPDDPNCTGDACSPPPIYCVGVECDSPGFENNPVRTLWTQDGIE